MNNANVSMSMSLTTSSAKGGDRWRLEIRDDLSGLVLFRVSVQLETFARLIAGQYMSGLAAEVADQSEYAKKLNKHHEVKTEKITFDPTKPFTDEIRSAAKPFEVDGWRLVESCAERANHHRGGPAGYTITLERWVYEKTPKAEPAPKPEVKSKPKRGKK